MTQSATPPSPGAKRSLYTLFLANVISWTGNQFAFLAIPWFVLATTGSAAQTGITAFFTLAPLVIGTFFGGTLVDRTGFKAASVIADIASGITVLFIPLLFGLDLLPFWLLQVLVFLGTLLDAPGATARNALLPDLAEAAAMPLERVTSLNQITERGSRLLGFPLAGFLIAFLDAPNVLYLNAVSFFISALLVWLVVPANKTTPEDGKETTQTATSYLEDLRAGLGYLRQDALLLTIVAIVLVSNFLDSALSSVIYPVYVSEVYGSAIGLGLLFGMSGGGAVVGALLYGTYGASLPRRKIYLGAWLGIALARMVLIFLPPLWVLLLASVLVGISAGPLNPIMHTVAYERIPPAMRGRTLGIIGSGALLATPLSVLLAGYALEWLGLVPTVTIVLVGYLLTAVSLFFNRQLHAMDIDKAV